MGDTICAVATPPGRGGIGIVRISGPECASVAINMLGRVPLPRTATRADFCGDTQILDSGIALYYPNPASYTGEDVLELQGHGSPVVLGGLVEYILTLNVRLANPGEFTERAFRNDKLDLAQAEAVAELIASGSAEAARAATRSLTGEFSRCVYELDQAILSMRVFVETAIDFAEEEIDFLNDTDQQARLSGIQTELTHLLDRTATGLTMQRGLDVAIAGRPNVGKSSLLNGLLGENRAIVTPMAGTTRDTLHGEISLDGLPIRLTDTAGLHASENPIEIIGIERARDALSKADCVLWVVDDSAEHSLPPSEWSDKTIVVRNKCDLSRCAAGQIGPSAYRTSALTGTGLAELCDGLKRIAGFRTGADAFAGRPRHVGALKHVHESLLKAEAELADRQGELVAENLRIAHNRLGEIVGITTSDDLLGEIFSTFCIGK